MSGPEHQLELGLGPFRNQRLFSSHFLQERLPEWRDFAFDTPELLRELGGLWKAEAPGLATANEAQTEERWIQPVLRALGFAYTVQAGVPVGLNRRQPDYALFVSDDDRAQADGLDGVARYDRAVAVADAKRFDRPLDRRRAAGALSEDPVAQIINYLSITRRRWGILTNGRLWRLYAAEADLVSGACYEVDLVALLQGENPEAFRYFAGFFSASSFVSGPDGTSFLDRALSESQANTVAVGETLERQVFSAVPLIAEGLLGGEPRTEEALGQAFDHSLVLLYRLLFCLHAEARELLPVDNPHYYEYSLRKQKIDLAHDRDRGRVFSTASDDLYNDLRALFRIVDKGDGALGVGEYNGGLFSAGRHPYFANRSVPDHLLAPALEYLYRVRGEVVDYRDLSVRHLGTIYERLLDYRLNVHAGQLALAPASGRRETGSYFTPEHIVDRIVERTLEPVLARRSASNAQKGLRGQEALESFLTIRVLDPAMGSGHFLVSTAAFIAQYVATDPSYDGELSLGDIQRLVAARCVYGVDVNPMAVELARLSLWLTTVQRDEPLTFLNNLRDGNSLVGADLGELLRDAETLFAERLVIDVGGILARLEQIESPETDVHEKERLADIAENLRSPLEEHASEKLASTFSNGIGRLFHWELEFPEVFLDRAGRPRVDAGFDAIVGNPPYVRIQALGRELAAFCRKRYATASGSFDTYIPFIERSLALLTPDGRLGFIVPNKFLKLEHAQRLRERLADDHLVEELIDFGGAQVFEGATNYTCVLILDRTGRAEFQYRRVRGNAATVRRTLVNVDGVPKASFNPDGLGSEAWVLATGEEAAIITALQAGSDRLDSVSQQIFQGLVTSADPVYILEDRGRRGANQVVYSRASDVELELEPALLHPLASGTDVGRYAFAPLRQLLLFPYGRFDGKMQLVPPDRLANLPLTKTYLGEHEERLRGRERKKMDHEAWYGYVYPKNLAAHDMQKLAVPRLCDRLRASADPDGGVYLDNVDVGGVLVGGEGPSIWTLLVLLNSRLLDWVFRRHSVPFRGEFWSANKQFIAPLPIRVPDDALDRERIDQLGVRLHERSEAVGNERAGFLAWLGDRLEADPAKLKGSTILASYHERSLTELLQVLERNKGKLKRNVGSRTFREEFEEELTASLDRIGEAGSALTQDERAADDVVFDLYRLTARQRSLVESDLAPKAHPDSTDRSQ